MFIVICAVLDVIGTTTLQRPVALAELLSISQGHAR